MKRISIYTLSAAFLILLGITSCSKTTKGKMTDEWKVTSFRSVESVVNIFNDKYTTTFWTRDNTVLDESVTEQSGEAPSTQSQTGSVNKHEFTIKKDGTWTWTSDVTFVNGNTTKNSSKLQSGTWSFVGKTKGDDFKKNERVLFNVLSTTTTDVETANQVVVNDHTHTLTYSTGENSMVYTIKESKKDLLEMELEEKMVYTEGAKVSTTTLSQKIVLEGK
ncbi:hypothetical protein D3C71_901370 [compost metagenome]